MDVGRQVRSLEHQIAHPGIVAKAFGDAPEADASDGSGRIAEQRQAGAALADFGQRRRDGTRHRLAAGNGRLQRRRSGTGDVDQFGIDEQRRLRQNRRGDLRLIDRQRYDDVVRRPRARAQHFGKRPTHLRRRIVEQNGERCLNGDGDLGIDLGLEVESTERAGRAGAMASGRTIDPIEELAGKHGDLSPILRHLVRKVIKASFTMLRG